MKRAINAGAALAGLLFLLAADGTQAQTAICYKTGNTAPGCQVVTPAAPLPVTGTFSATVSFPTIGAAVPSTGVYDGLNVAGALRGWTGVNPSGSIYAGQVDNTSWAGTALGSPSNFGTTPGAVAVPGVNASLFQGTAIISATNGTYANLLQGNAALSATNGTYANLLVGNAAVATGTGAQGATVPRVTVATDSATVAGSTPDPCQANTKHFTPISITTATTTNIITGASAKKTYICQLILTSAAADNVAIIEGTTGGTCGAGTAGLLGGTTAANGPNFAANGGLSIGNGAASVLATSTNQNDVCLITSAATPLAGSVVWVQQ